MDLKLKVENLFVKDVQLLLKRKTNCNCINLIYQKKKVANDARRDARR
jgi:hypothetical protein